MDGIMKKRVFDGSMLRQTRVTTILMLVLVGLLTGCGGKTPPAGEIAAAERMVVSGVTTEMAKVESVVENFEAVGVVRARTSTVISSKVVGTITALRVHEGDRVRAGQVLIEIENRDARVQVDKAQAGLREVQSSIDELDRNLKAAVAARTAAEANRRLAEATLRRYQMLRERKSVSDQEFEEVEARAQVAVAEVDRAEKMRQVVEARRQMIEARIDQAKADVAGAQVYAGYARITSPVDGVVTIKQVDIGALAAPGAPLLTVEGGGTFRLEAAVEESRIGKIAFGATAQVKVDAVGGAVLPGRVVEIVPTADPGSRTFTVRIDLPVNAALRSGQYGKAVFASGEREALLVSGAAIVRRGQLTGVYVVDEKGIVHLRLVTLGRESGARVEVLSGLKDGEKLVAESSRIEREGVQIK